MELVKLARVPEVAIAMASPTIEGIETTEPLASETPRAARFSREPEALR